MPDASSLQTARMPSQQFCEALMLTEPPSGSVAVPQMFPTPLHALPLLQRPPVQRTEPLGFTPPPQQASSLAHEVPVRRQPPAGRHTVAPEPGSKQVREQQLEPPEHGLPSWVQPPPPPPVMARHTPTPPSGAEQALPQHSTFELQRSPVGWQEYARAHRPLLHSVEQHSALEAQASPNTRQLPPGTWAQVPLVQVRVQQSAATVQAWPVAPQVPLAHAPLTHELLQHSESAVQAALGSLQKVEARHTEPTQEPQHGACDSHAWPAATQAPPSPPLPLPPSPVPPSASGVGPPH